VVFSFYGQSVLQILHDELTKAGYSVSINHGAMSGRDRQRSQDAFKRGETQIFLSSDAGARGLNLGIGSSLIHYEPSLTWANHEQRGNRIHRIGGTHPSVNIQMMVARDTRDERALAAMQASHQASEDAIDFDVDDDETGFVTAAMRRRMIETAKAR
jgi:SNF2 family DNA or RNA helicase